MSKNSHLEWKVKYQPGTLLARGYKNGKEKRSTLMPPPAIRPPFS